MQIEISNAPANGEDVSALELPLRLSHQLVDELQALNSVMDQDFYHVIQKIRHIRDTIMSISHSMQRIHDSIISDLILVCERLENDLHFRHANSRGDSLSENIQQYLD